MITYRIVQFRCNCRYIYTGVNNRPSKCQEHGTTQKSVTFWCDICGTKHTVKPLSGLKKRCYWCSMYKQRGDINLAFQKKYNKEHNIQELTSETLSEKDERHLDECFSKVREKFRPPVVDGINEAIL